SSPGSRSCSRACRGSARRRRRRSRRPRSASPLVRCAWPRPYYRRGMAIQVAVIGSGAEHEERAEAVGRLLAERGCTVVTGGLGEVMAAAARGAKSAGGTTIGILPGEDPSDASEWIDHVVVTGIGHARNLAVVASGEAVVAVGGAWGTLSEIALASILGRPVVVLEPGWAVDGEGVVRAASAEVAVELALRLIRTVVE